MFSRKKQPPIKSLIAFGTTIDGNLKFSDGLRIDGEIRGDIRAEDADSSILVISETAHVIGAVHAQHVIINGTVTGPVFASELLELQPKARINGDIQYKALEMHLGALVSGGLSHTAIEADKPTLKLASNS